MQSHLLFLEKTALSGLFDDFDFMALGSFELALGHLRSIMTIIGHSRSPEVILGPLRWLVVV